jgi:ABC-type sugar transport system substrate-binding protein
MKKSLLTLMSVVIAFSLILGLASVIQAQTPTPAAGGTPAATGPSPTPYYKDASKAPYEVQFNWGTFKLADYIAKHIKEGAKLKIRDSWHDPSEVGWGPVLQDGAKAAAEEFGFDYQMVGPMSGKVSEQASMMDDLIVNQVPDCLVVAQQTADLFNPLINKAMDAGIPTFAYNIDAPNSHRIAHYGQHLPESGRQAAREFLKYHGKKAGKIALFGGLLASDYVIDRLAGFKEVIQQEVPDMKFVGPTETGYERDKAYSIIENVYTANPDITGMYFTEAMCIPGADFVERNKLQDKVTVVGFNVFPEMLPLIESGALDSTIGQFIYSQGYVPASMCYKFLTKGELPPVVFNDTGSEVVDKTNYQKYVKK